MSASPTQEQRQIMRLMPTDDTTSRSLTKRIFCAVGVLILGPFFFILNIVSYGILSQFGRREQPKRIILRRRTISYTTPMRTTLDELTLPPPQSKSEPSSPEDPHSVSFSSTSKPSPKKRWSSPAKIFSFDHGFISRRSSITSGSTSPTLCSPSPPPRFFPELSRVDSVESMTESEYDPQQKNSLSPPLMPSFLQRKPSSLHVKLPSVGMFRTKSRRTPGASPAMLRRKSESPSPPSTLQSSLNSLRPLARRMSTSPSHVSQRRASAPTTIGMRRAPSGPVQAARRAIESSPRRASEGDADPAMRRAPTSPARASLRQELAALAPPAQRHRTNDIGADRVRLPPRSPPAGQEPRPTTTLTTTFVNPFKPKPRRARTTIAHASADPQNRALAVPPDCKRRAPAPAPVASSSAPPPPSRRTLSSILHIATPSFMRRTSTPTCASPPPPGPPPRTQPYGPPYYAKMPGEPARGRGRQPVRRQGGRSRSGSEVDAREKRSVPVSKDVKRGSCPEPTRGKQQNSLGLSLGHQGGTTPRQIMSVKAENGRGR